MDWRDDVRAAVGATASAPLREGPRGAWTASWILGDDARRWFVKCALPRYAGLLTAEAEGLDALRRTATIRVPRVIAQGERDAVHWLALEWLDLAPPEAAGAALGAALAALHAAPAPSGPRGERYGWHTDNFIGGTPQANGWSVRWIDFWRERRLRPQLVRAFEHGYADSLREASERLQESLDALLAGHEPAPSLLHGDLWGGNAGVLRGGEAVVFDPAVYVGDREADLAMTELFGGFAREFQAAYRDALPVDAGYVIRRDLYNLYHLLNHLNLFGEGYLVRCERAIARLLAHA
jgi:fructosamine-3-kinase